MKKIIWIILAILLVGGGVKILKKKKQGLAYILPMKVYYQVVSTVTPPTENIALTLPALAQVQSDLDVELSSRLSARITSMVKSGDMVSRGQTVVTLDHDELLAKKEAIKLQILSLEADINAQKIGLDNMISTHKRTKELLDVRGASVEQYEAEKSKIASMRAGLQGLRGKKGILEQNNRELTNLLSYAVIVSPIDGLVSSTSANVGVIAMPGKPLLSIQASSGKYLLIRSADDVVPEKVVFENQTYPLVPLNHTYRGLDEYRADVKTNRNSGERLPVRLVIYQGTGIMVPQSALLQREGQSFCFVPDGESTRPVPVKIIASGTEGVVVEGLSARQVISAKPDILLKLLAGVPVEIQG